MTKPSFILLLAMVLAASVGKAQDTIFMCPYEYYPAYMTHVDVRENNPFMPDVGKGVGSYSHHKAIDGYAYYAPQTTVYGIAMCLKQFHISCTGNSYTSLHTTYIGNDRQALRTDNLPIGAMLIQKHGDSLRRIDSVGWHYRSKPDKIWKYSCRNQSFFGTEFYFDHPIQMDGDTFFFCVTIGGNDSVMAPCTETDSNYAMWVYCGLEIYPSMETEETIYNHFHQPLGGIKDTIVHIYSQASILYLPIITPPDTDAVGCPPPRLRFLKTVSGYPWFRGTLTTDEEAVGYEIRYAPVGSDTWESAYSTSNPFRIHAELDSTINYRGCFRSKHRHGCAIHDTTYWSPWSDTVIFHAGSTASISPVEADGGLFTLAPNPATGMVTVTWELGEQLSLTLTDAAGHEVLRMPMPAGQTTATLDVSNLPKGIYFVTLTTSQGSSSRQLVVQ